MSSWNLNYEPFHNQSSNNELKLESGWLRIYIEFEWWKTIIDAMAARSVQNVYNNNWNADTQMDL